MKCRRCQHDNDRPNAKFCENCGAAMALVCASCGADVSPTAKFCAECGRPIAPAPAGFTSPETYTPKYLADRILTSKTALEGERKQVTVLFVDVSGFTSLSERLDPEDVHRLMTRAFELMLAEAALRQSLSIGQVIGNPTQLWKTYVATGRLHEARGKREDARAAYRAADDVLEGIARSLEHPALREPGERPLPSRRSRAAPTRF